MPGSTVTLVDFGSCKASGGSRGGARGAPGPPLFFDQNEARRAEKNFFVLKYLPFTSFFSILHSFTLTDFVTLDMCFHLVINKELI